MLQRLLAILALVPLILAACGGSASPATLASSSAVPAATATPKKFVSTATPGPRMTPAELAAFVGLFTDQPFAGGQKMPYLAMWAQDDTFVWLQLDKDDPKQATTVKAWGIGTKGTYCNEAMPDATGKSFTHFQQFSAPDWTKGAGGAAGAQGYWLSAISLEKPGIDYAFAPSSPAPSCGSAQRATFAPAGAAKLSGEKLKSFVSSFDYKPLSGGQVPPRLYKSVTEDVSLMIQPDKTDPATVTEVRYVGLSLRGVFCKEAQPSPDFPHYHRQVAATYGQGHGGLPGESAGYWLLWVATRPITDSAGKTTGPGIDREFSIINDIPRCP